MTDNERFHCCSLCGKKLIKRLSNGILVFSFGKGGGNGTFVPVKMQIHGSIRMQCLRRSCRAEHPDYYEEITLFPPAFQSGSNPNRISGSTKINSKGGDI